MKRSTFRTETLKIEFIVVDLGFKMYKLRAVILRALTNVTVSK